MPTTRNAPDVSPVPGSSPGPGPEPGRYDIDPGRSSVTFATRHLLGLAPVRGSFAVRSGTVRVAGPGGTSGVEATIDAASFRTGNPQRDAAVRSPRFLGAGRFPAITFTADCVHGTDIEGTLTVRDVSRPVRLAVRETIVSPGSFTAIGHARVDRTRFGVTAARGLAGRHLDLTVEVQCVRR